jgi:hypothetical protein
MSGKKPWLGIAVGAGLVLNGCAGMTKNQAALVGAASCGAAGAGGGAAIAHNGVNGTPKRSYRSRDRVSDRGFALWWSGVFTDAGTKAEATTTADSSTTSSTATTASSTTTAAEAETGTTATATEGGTDDYIG